MQIEIDKHTAEFLRSLIRGEIRSMKKKDARMSNKFGQDYDPTKAKEKAQFLRELYRDFGGDPDRIQEHGGRTDREQQDD